MPDVTYELLQGKKKRREKEMLGWAFFPAPCAQVSIRLVFDFSLKMQPPQPGHTPGGSASTQPLSLPSSQQGLQFSVKSLLVKPGSCQHLPVYLWSRKGQEEEWGRGGGQPLFGVTHSFTQKTLGKTGRRSG